MQLPFRRSTCVLLFGFVSFVGSSTSLLIVVLPFLRGEMNWDRQCGEQGDRGNTCQCF